MLEHTHKNILLVEDEFLIAMTEKMQLEKYGYAVKTVNSGEQAIEAVTTSSDIDLILMDINLGDGIDGTETAAIILKDHDIPIVFVSSHSEREIVEKTEKITSYGYVVKNSSITVLDASIKMAFKLFDAKMVSQKKEALIYEHEEKYRLLHQYAGVGIGYYSLDGIVLSFNQLAAKHLGGVPEDFIGKSIFDIFPKPDADGYFNRIHRAASSENPDVYEDVVPLPNGNMYFLSTFTKIVDSDQNLLGIQIISQDITERKNNEDIIIKNEKRYKGLLENLDVGIVVHAPDTSIIMNNPRASALLGLSDHQLKGKAAIDPAWRFVSEATTPLPLSEYPVNRIVAGKKPIFAQILGVHQPEVEQLVWLSVNGFPMMDDNGQISEIIISFSDITARRQSEQALQIKNEEYETINEELRSTTEELQLQNVKLIQSHEYLIQAEKIAKIGNWTLQLNTKSILASNGADEIYGVEFKRVPLAEVQKIPLAEYRPALDKALSDLVTQGIPYDLEFKICRKGDYKIRDIHSVATYDKRTNTVFGVIQDITEIKDVENKLSRSLDKIQLLLDSAAVGIFGIDLNGNCTFCNISCIELLGYTDESELIGKDMHSIIHSKHHDGTEYPVEQCRIYKSFRDGVQVHEVDEVLWRSDGSSFPVEYWSCPQEENGRIVGAVVSFLNIAERRQTELALKKSQERLSFALEGSNLGEWDWNLNTNVLTRNRRWAEMLGYSPDELTNSLYQGIELQHPDDREKSWSAVQDHLAGRTDSFSIEYRMRTKSGAYKWIHDCGRIMERDQRGNPLRFCGTHADIDEKKSLENVISESNTLLYSMLDSSPDVIIFALDTNYNYLAFNSRHKDVIKNIWGRDISIGTNMLEIIGEHADRRKAKESFDKALQGESFVIVEDYGNEALSRQSWLDYYSPIKKHDGTIIGFTCFLINNTKQKLAQDKIESLLAEKELILKEVHHRIKNNMNTISSLLSLQAGTVKEKSAVLALQDAGNRIQSMSLLYDKLYRSNDYNELSMKTYMSSLVDEVISNFPNSHMVKVEMNFQEFVLDVKRLQSIGIMTNELLTNIMKYAFVEKDCGTIMVSATRDDGRILVSIQDDGVGIPESIGFDKSTGFGLQLVQMLAQQLEGKIRMERGNGTKVELEFAL